MNANHSILTTKNKTWAAWLALLTGPFGGHRFYLYGFTDTLGWLLPIPTAVGLYGVQRMLELGQDDVISWILVPVIGFVMAFCALTAIVYGLTESSKWNAQFAQASEHPAGKTNWFTIFALVLSLLLGAVVLMSSIVYSFQRYFEYQIVEAQKISQ